MFLFPFLFILFIRSVISDDFIFDISKPEGNDNIIKVVRRVGDIWETAYIPYAYTRIIQVNDGPMIIWMAPPGMHCGNVTFFSIYESNKMARMRVITPRGSEFIWFENYRGVWIQLTEKTFVESWERLKRVRKFEFDKPFNKLVFTKQPYSSITGIGTIIFIDRGYKVMAVVDGEQELWSSEEQTCNYILIHGEVGGAESATDGQGEFSGARLVNISVRFKDKYEDLYFAKMGKYWIECQYSQFRKMLIEERDRLCMNITETRKENTDGREYGPSTSGNS